MSPALITSPEKHDAVSVGVRLGLVEDHHRFAVEEEVLGWREVFIVRQPGLRRRGLIAGDRLCHPVQNVFVRDDGRASSGGRRRSGRAHFLQRLVAAHMIRVYVGIDNVADRLA
jgi:hypothetical protein